MKKHRRLIISSIILAVVIIATAVASRLYYANPTLDTKAMVEEQQFYSVVDDKGQDVLHVVVYPGKDTIVSDARDTVFLRSVTRQRPASWVNRTWMPFCFGCLASKIDEAAERKSALPPLSDNSISPMLALEVKQMTAQMQMYKLQIEEIDYYLNSHSMQDEGFDIVVRRREWVKEMQDSLASLLSVVKKTAKNSKLSLQPRTLYTVVADTLRLPAHAVSGGKDGFLMFRTDGGRMPSSARPVYLGVDDIGYGMTPAKPLAELQDTVYIGRRDKTTGKFVGNAAIICRNGSYYEGEVLDTLYKDSVVSRIVRHGTGVLFDGEKVRAGLWKNDVYKGEQPLYTANHIYGIDISRYQHEPADAKTVTHVKRVKVRGRWRKVKTKVKVTYPIDWSRLRITSLGTKSKKKIDGVVDYPISFVYIKCTEGSSLYNKYYNNDYVQARRHGYRVGSYHFYSTRTYAASQAAYFLRCNHYQKGDLPPVLDLEPTPQQVAAMGGAKAMLASARKWLEIVERRIGVRPILYVSQKFVNRYMIDKYPDGIHLKKNYQVWIARYGEFKPDVHLVFWQLCPDGRVQGIHGHTDINIFNGYQSSFKAFGR